MDSIQRDNIQDPLHLMPFLYMHAFDIHLLVHDGNWHPYPDSQHGNAVDGAVSKQPSSSPNLGSDGLYAYVGTMAGMYPAYLACGNGNSFELNTPLVLSGYTYSVVPLYTLGSGEA